jgi:hypothetical protein
MPTPLQQAITAIKAGDKQAGKRLLAETLQANPCEESAWIWMSAVVDSDVQRRDCLERVLAINPNNEIARQGLARLGRFASPARAAQDVAAPLVQAAAAPAPEPPARMSPAAYVDTSREDQIAGWLAGYDRAKPAVTDEAEAGRGQPIAKEEATGPAVRGEAQVAAVDFVVSALGKHHLRNDIIMALCRDHGFDWKEAETFIRKVESEKGRSIAARQSPLVLIIGVGTVLAGVALGGYGLLELLNGVVAVRFGYIFGGVWVPTPVMIITGLGMIAGGAYGTFRTLGKLRR